MTAPLGYTLLDKGIRCRCVNLWKGADDTYYCCNVRKDFPNNVDHPSHYGGDTVYETIKVLSHWMTPEQLEGFCVGNAIKYLSRWHKKNGVEDLKKALWYLEYYTNMKGRSK